MTNPEGGGRGALIAAVITALLVALFFTYQFSNEPPHWRMNLGESLNFTLLVFFLDRAFYILTAAAVLAAACGAGLAVLARFDCDGLTAAQRIALAGAFGLGILSLATLLLGLAGLLNRFTAVALVVVLAVCGARRARGFLREGLAKGFGGRLSALEWFLAAGILVAGLLTLLYSFNPPMNFDALEYHLGAPAQYYRGGAIRYIEHNVYSNFPGNSEMLYLFSMVLAGSKMAGAILGKVLHAYMAFLAALTAYCLGRWLFSRGAGLFAAFALLSSGSFFEISTDVYVEGLQTLYTLTAFLAVAKFLSGGKRGWLAAGAVAAGLSFGVKYPAALFVILPLSAAVLLRRVAWKERLVSLGILAGISLAVASPWLIKNLIFTGNPVYPLLYGMLGGRDWGDLQNARWIMAHTPKGGLALRQWAEHVFGRFFAEGVIFAAAYAALYIFLWFAVTHRIARFLVPALAVAGAVSGAGLFSVPKGLL
ncbi:MAG: ArnT family glycosyltransferase, partial [Planctomycetota bacterium]